ncbi:MAG: 2-oxo-4-hydroxy-4-carboxy-5-ureidoimidazoline decarboxylase [Chloroflexota bacterium]
MTGGLDLADLNAAGPAAYVATLAPLFEGAPRFLGRLEAGRPDPDWESLFSRARTLAHTMPLSEQIELIDAHPRLGASPETVSAASYHEQGYPLDSAAASSADDDAARQRAGAELERLNVAYEARFGFRYCVYVAGRSWAALVPEMAASLAADPQTERTRALDAVVDIAMARWSALGGRDG